MGRKHASIQRSTSSFHMSRQLVMQFDALMRSNVVNPSALSRAEFVETLIHAVVTGHIRVPSADAIEAFGQRGSLPVLADTPIAPPTAGFVPPAASYPYVQPPMAPPPMPPPSPMIQAPDAPITPAEAASLGSIASVDANEHYKVTNRRRLDFAHHIVANILGRSEDAALLTPHLIDIPATTFHLPPTGLSQPWGNPDLASREEHARRAFDRGFLKPWLDTGLPALLELAKENPAP